MSLGQRARPWLGFVTLSACLAVFTCFISSNLNARFVHHQETVLNQFAILHGQAQIFDGVPTILPQFQSRIMFPALLAGATRAGLLSASQWFVILRIVTAFGAFGSFIALCWIGGRMTLANACLGAGVLAYGVVFTFNHPWEHPTDFLDVAFASGFLWLTLRKRRWLLALLVLLATFNHQTAAFASVIWFCMWGVNRRSLIVLPEAIYALLLAVGSYAAATAVKISIGPETSVRYLADGWRTIPQFLEAVRHPQPFMWPVLLIAMILPVILWLVSNRQIVNGDLRRLLWAAGAIVILSSPIAFWSELRSVFLVPMVIATFTATSAEARAQSNL